MADRLLVQRMVDGLGEVLLSVHHDTDAGRVVMLAAGGILAEIHKDRSIRLAPVDHDGAREMIGEVKALEHLLDTVDGRVEILMRSPKRSSQYPTQEPIWWRWRSIR